MSALGWYSAEVAVLTSAAGILLIYLELARPGLVLPGALGGILFLVSLARLSEAAWDLIGITLFLLGLSALGVEIWKGGTLAPGAVAGALWTLAAVRLTADETNPQWWVVLPACYLVAALSVKLGAAALLAYTVKHKLD